MKPRVVLDTTVLVSGLLGGTATEVIEQWRAKEIIMSHKVKHASNHGIIKPETLKEQSKLPR